MLFFFFNDTAPTEIYTLPLHDVLPISRSDGGCVHTDQRPCTRPDAKGQAMPAPATSQRNLAARIGGWSAAHWKSARSEEHKSELQSRQYLVCRVLLEKKTLIKNTKHY